jgi:hypothetical protein
VAQAESFRVRRDKARKTKLEAEQHRGLAERQHAARKARSHTDELGMVHIHMELEPHVGPPIVARAEAEAQRLARKARAADMKEPFERHLADAYAALLSGSGPRQAARAGDPGQPRGSEAGLERRARGRAVQDPRRGAVSPQVAREIAKDAFLNGVFFDGMDLRNFKQ